MVVRGLVAGMACGATLASAVVVATGHGDVLLPSRSTSEAVAKPEPSVAEAAPASVRPHASAPVEVALPAGFRKRTVSEARIELGVPRRWAALTRRDATFPGVIQTLTGTDRSLRASLVGLTMPDSPLKLFAFDLRSGVGEAATASVLLSESPPAGAFGVWSAAVRREVERLPSLHGPVRSTRIVLPAGEALRLEYVRTAVLGDRERTLATVQFVVVADGRAISLVFAAPVERLKAYAPTFRAAARTLVLR